MYKNPVPTATLKTKVCCACDKFIWSSVVENPGYDCQIKKLRQTPLKKQVGVKIIVFSKNLSLSSFKFTPAPLL